jgi:hypothetical protein
MFMRAALLCGMVETLRFMMNKQRYYISGACLQRTS